MEKERCVWMDGTVNAGKSKRSTSRRIIKARRTHQLAFFFFLFCLGADFVLLLIIAGLFPPAVYSFPPSFSSSGPRKGAASSSETAQRRCASTASCDSGEESTSTTCVFVCVCASGRDLIAMVMLARRMEARIRAGEAWMNHTQQSIYVTSKGCCLSRDVAQNPPPRPSTRSEAARKTMGRAPCCGVWRRAQLRGKNAARSAQGAQRLSSV